MNSSMSGENLCKSYATLNTTVLLDLCPYFKTPVVVYAERTAIFNTPIMPLVLKAACSVKGSFAHDETVSYGQYICTSRITEPNPSLAWLQGRVQFMMFKAAIWGHKLKWLQSASRASTSTHGWATFALALLQNSEAGWREGEVLWAPRICPPALTCPHGDTVLPAHDRLLCHKAPHQVPDVSLPRESSGVPQGQPGS